jgi:hypothetical protein
MEKKRSIWIFTGFLSTSTALFLLFVPEIMNGFETLKLYVNSWEFSGFLFRSLRTMSIHQTFIRIFLGSVFFFFLLFLTLKTDGDKKDESARLQQHLQIFHSISMAYLLLTPTFHPWYALYLAAFLPFVPDAASICLSWSVFISYYILIVFKETGLWQEGDLMALLVFSAPVSAFFCQFLTKRFFQNRQVTAAE